MKAQHSAACCRSTGSEEIENLPEIPVHQSPAASQRANKATLCSVHVAHPGIRCYVLILFFGMLCTTM